MLRPILCVLVAGLVPALPTTLAVRAQSPAMPTLAISPQMRFVDFSKDLDRNGITVVLGKLGKCKEGKRERRAEPEGRQPVVPRGARKQPDRSSRRLRCNSTAPEEQREITEEKGQRGPTKARHHCITPRVRG